MALFRIYNAMIREQVQLQQEQEKLDHVFSILEEGIILVDDDYNIVHFNSKAAKLLDFELVWFFCCVFGSLNYLNRLNQKNVHLQPILQNRRN
jgi:transcriptional regulator with PAS, ATPase and Fis domain